ncbi:MAG: hypothetical protein L0Z62_30625, partial [Gemmataceae bacterium]|nr:hypothetical protein [Gemmataceae bacterium]
LKTRVSAGRELLGRRLQRRGVTLGAGGVAAALTTGAATAAVPLGLAQGTTTAAVGFAAGASGVASSEAGLVAQEVLRATIPTRVRLAVVLILVLALGGAGWALFGPGPAEPLPPKGGAAVKPPEVKPPEPRLDRNGDPLPKVAEVEALARLGTTRLRLGGESVDFVAFLPDGKRLLTVDGWMARKAQLWEVPSGKELRCINLPSLDPDNGKKGGQLPADHPSYWLRRMVAVSADGKTLVAIGADFTFRVWDIETGEERVRLQTGLKGHFFSIALSPDGQTLAVCWFGDIELWNLQQKKKVRTVPRPPPMDGVRLNDTALAFSPDGKLLADLSNFYEADKERFGAPVVRLLDSGTGREKLRIKVKEEGSADELSFSPDGKWLAWRICDFGKPEDRRRLCNAWTGEVMHTYETFGMRSGTIFRPTFTPDSKQLLDLTPDGSALQFLDVETRKVKRTVRHLAGRWTPGTGDAGTLDVSLAISPDGNLAAALGGMRSTILKDIRLFDLKKETILPALKGHTSTVRQVRFSRDGENVVTFSSDAREAYVWEAKTGKQTARLSLPGFGDFWAASWSSDGSTLALLSDPDQKKRREIMVWDPVAGKEVQRIKEAEPTKWAYVPYLSPDGKTLAVWTPAIYNQDYPTWLRLYDVATGKERLILQPRFPRAKGLRVAIPTGPTVVFSADGRLLAVAHNGEREVRLWDTLSGRELRPILRPLEDWRPGQPLTNYGMALSPDGRMVALVRNGGAILWEVATGRPRRQYGTLHPDCKLGHEEKLSSFVPAFSPDGRLLALSVRGSELLPAQAGGRPLVRGAEPPAALILDVATGKELARLAGHQSAIWSVAFAPDGRRLVTGSEDTTALVWDISRLGKAAPATKELSPKALDRLWAELRGDAAEKAYDAILALASARRQTVPLLQKRLRPAPAPDEQEVARLLAGLDAAPFAERQKAGAALERLGQPVLPALRAALDRKPPLETRKRLEALLERITARPLTPDEVRAVRAAEALERIGTPEARQVLQTLAGGAAGAPATEDARVALRRLGR